MLVFFIDMFWVMCWFLVWWIDDFMLEVGVVVVVLVE